MPLDIGGNVIDTASLAVTSNFTRTIVQDDLAFHIDAANKSSYAGSGTTVTNIARGFFTTLSKNNTLIGTTFNSSNGGSFVFNGTNNYISTPLNWVEVSFKNESLSACAWIKTPDNTQTAKIINKGLSSVFPSAPGGYSLRFIGRPVFDIQDSSSSTGQYVSVSASSVNDVPNNTWKYLVGVYDRPNLKLYLYIDGVLNNVATTPPFMTLLSSEYAPLSIGNLDRGGYGASSEFFNGNIAQVSLYGRALHRGEILANYYATKDRF